MRFATLANIILAVIGAPAIAGPPNAVAAARYRVATRPIIAIDSGHFNVHTAGTSYRPFAALARSDGDSVITNGGPFTAASLALINVLVISNARATASGPLADRGRPAYKPAELDALVDWVRNGGSLLLVISHYPIGGANYELGARFGIDMLNGMTRDSSFEENATVMVATTTPGGAIGSTPLTGPATVFDRARHRIGDHPVTCGAKPEERVDRVIIHAGVASFNAPAGATPLLLFSDSAMDYVGPEATPRSAKGRNQAVALSFGKGKVLALGDAAMFANVDDPTTENQNRRFALNALRWLSGSLDGQGRNGCRTP